jgi:hypothetical protein
VRASPAGAEREDDERGRDQCCRRGRRTDADGRPCPPPGERRGIPLGCEARLQPGGDGGRQGLPAERGERALHCQQLVVVRSVLVAHVVHLR